MAALGTLTTPTPMSTDPTSNIPAPAGPTPAPPLSTTTTINVPTNDPSTTITYTVTEEDRQRITDLTLRQTFDRGPPRSNSVTGQFASPDTVHLGFPSGTITGLATLPQTGSPGSSVRASSAPAGRGTVSQAVTPIPSASTSGSGTGAAPAFSNAVRPQPHITHVSGGSAQQPASSRFANGMYHDQAFQALDFPTGRIPGLADLPLGGGSWGDRGVADSRSTAQAATSAQSGNNLNRSAALTTAVGNRRSNSAAGNSRPISAAQFACTRPAQVGTSGSSSWAGSSTPGGLAVPDSNLGISAPASDGTTPCTASAATSTTARGVLSTGTEVPASTDEEQPNPTPQFAKPAPAGDSPGGDDSASRFTGDNASFTTGQPTRPISTGDRSIGSVSASASAADGASASATLSTSSNSGGDYQARTHSRQSGSTGSNQSHGTAVSSLSNNSKESTGSNESWKSARERQ